MTDDLLDSAERIADERLRRKRLMPDRIAYVLRALVERVRYAEQGRDETFKLWQRASMAVLRLTDERDEARTKLDAVRTLVEDSRQAGKRLSALDICDILDGK